MGATVKRPCQGCVYFAQCGNNSRTMPCEGRATKSEYKRRVLQSGESLYKNRITVKSVKL